MRAHSGLLTLGLVTFHLTRPEVEHEHGGVNWVEDERPGDYPLLLAKGRRLRRMTLTGRGLYLVGSPGMDPEALLDRLRRFADSEEMLVVAYGPAEAGIWQLENLRYSSTQRRQGSNRMSEAEWSLDFKQASPVPRVGGVPTAGALAAR